MAELIHIPTWVRLSLSTFHHDDHSRRRDLQLLVRILELVFLLTPQLAPVAGAEGERSVHRIRDPALALQEDDDDDDHLLFLRSDVFDHYIHAVLFLEILDKCGIPGKTRSGYYSMIKLREPGKGGYLP